MRKLIIVSFLILFGISAVSAQVKFQSAIEKTTAQVGEPVRLRFLVDGSDSVELPAMKENSDFSMTYEGGEPRTETRMYTMNDQTTRQDRKSFIGAFTIRPKHAGKIEIPPLTFVSEGKQFRSDAFIISVTPARKNDNFILRWRMPSTSLVEGQPISLTVEFLYRERVKALSFSFPFLRNPDVTWERSAPQAGIGADESFSFQAEGTEIYGRKTTGESDGKKYEILEVKLTGHPKKAGSIALGSIVMDIAGKTGSQTGTDFFGEAVTQDKYENFSFQTEPITLDIRPLPGIGKPANFGGIIGTLSISSRIAATTLGLGDPVELTVTLNGIQNEVNLESAIVSALSADSGIKASLKEKKTGQDGSVNYVFVSRFRESGARAVEPIVLSYFDPELRQYKEARSNRVPVTVTSSAVLDPSNVVGSWKAGSGSANDLRQNPADRALFPGTKAPFTGIPFHPYLILLACPPLWIAFAFLGGKGRTARRRRKKMLSQASAIVEWDELRLAALLSRNNGTFSRMAHADAGFAASWAEWMNSFDRVRFSPLNEEKVGWLERFKTYCLGESFR